MEESSSTTRAGADLSALYKHTGGCVQYDPTGKYLAVAKGNRITIRSAINLDVIQLFCSVDVVQYIEWSKDSKCVLAAMYLRGILQVFSLPDPTWECTINHGVAGMVTATWAPDSMHVLTISDFQLQLTVWSLTTRASYVIRRPKLKMAGITFSPDGRFLAVAERIECKDYIGLYDCVHWQRVHHFLVESYDLSSICWAPDNSAIYVQECLLEYNIYFYAPDGRLQGKYQAYQGALGIKMATWSTSGQLLALGSFDQKIRLVNNLTWQPIVEFDHDINSSALSSNIIGYEEFITTDDSSQATAASNKENSGALQDAAAAMSYRVGGKKKHVATVPFLRETISFATYNELPAMPVLHPDPKDSQLKHGVGLLSFSMDSKFLASRNDSMPNTLWIWDTTSMTPHSVIVLLDGIKSARWNPHKNVMAFCSASNRVYLWSLEGTSWIDVPSDQLGVLGLRWNPTGTSVILLGKEDLCCVYL